MIEGVSFKVEAGGIRLDAVLAMRYPTTTRPFAREACEEGCVKVNGRTGSKGMKLKAGDLVEVASLAEVSDNRVMPNQLVKVRCIFEDDSLLAFDKPAGMPVQPIRRNETETLMNGVVARWTECAQVGDQPLMAGALHRIDADTSGLVLAARSQEAFDGMRAQFAAQTVEKRYLALVEGCVAVGGTLENELVHDPTLPFCRMIDVSRARAAVKAAPMRAVTNFVPVAHTQEGNEERTLLEVTIFTGVTHQIRAQLAMAGMHIVNDRLYGAFAIEGMIGHALHALSARFVHPLSGEPCEIRTSMPAWALV